MVRGPGSRYWASTQCSASVPINTADSPVDLSSSHTHEPTAPVGEAPRLPYRRGHLGAGFRLEPRKAICLPHSQPTALRLELLTPRGDPQRQSP